ncbi:uncharacterized protein LOC144478235 isoform X2 [Augochlora pura]
MTDDLKLVVDEARREMQNGACLKNAEERRLYYKYNNISWKFGKYATVFQLVLIILMSFRPLIHLSAQYYAGESNATIFYTLPFQAHIFFDYQNNIIIYFILYVYQLPMIYVAMFHIAEVSFIVTMVLHLCGKFSILCFRIRNVSTKPSSLFQKDIKSVVNQHLELRKMSEILNNNFYLLLLIEYISCSSRLSLSMYVVLTTLDTDPVAAANFVMYTLDVTAYLYLYSYIGEQLRCESQNIADALYNIEWQEMTNKDRRVLLMCMTNGQKTECLTAGKFYEFSLFGFTKLATLQLWDMCDVIRDFNALIEIATELPLTLSILYGLLLIRANKKLIVVVDRIQSDIKGALSFEDDEERQVYQKYNNISFYFGKYVSMFAFFISYMLYATPLIDLLTRSRPDQDNNTRPYVLPFRSHMFFDYHYNTKVYTLIYLYQLPVAFLGVYHAAEASLIVTSTLHICAKMSMLACRIRKSLTKSPAHFQQRMKTMVIEHLELTKMTDILNNCFRQILLVEYLNCSFRLGVTMYVVLITLQKDTVVAFNFILYTIIVAAWLYLYSYIGEQLLQESHEVGEAFYNTDWTDITSNDRRSLVICLMNGQKPLYLMAGKFYRFTLFGYSDIVKTAMAFLSVLRTRVE